QPNRHWDRTVKWSYSRPNRQIRTQIALRVTVYFCPRTQTKDARYMADNDDKRTDDTGAKQTLTLKGGPGLGNRPGMSRGPSRSTGVVEQRTRLVPKPNAPSNAPQRPQGGAPSNGRPAAGRPGQVTRAPLGLSAAEAEARRNALAMAGARAAEESERFAAEEARRIEEDARRRQVRE